MTHSASINYSSLTSSTSVQRAAIPSWFRLQLWRTSQRAAVLALLRNCDVGRVAVAKWWMPTRCLYLWMIRLFRRQKLVKKWSCTNDRRQVRNLLRRFKGWAPMRNRHSSSRSILVSHRQLNHYYSSKIQMERLLSGRASHLWIRELRTRSVAHTSTPAQNKEAIQTSCRHWIPKV